MACSFAKTRVRQDAERSLRDAGAPREEISVPPNPEILKSCQKHCKNPCQSVFIRGFISDSSTIVCQKNTLI
jgi:hypothetical protein